MIDEPCDGCGNTATHALCDECVNEDGEREAKLLAECRSECERQMKYGIAQHEAAQEATRERDALLLRVDTLTSALRGLLLSRDASWTGGHDWQEAVDQACRALGVEPGDE